MVIILEYKYNSIYTKDNKDCMDISFLFTYDKDFSLPIFSITKFKENKNDRTKQ